MNYCANILQRLTRRATDEDGRLRPNGIYSSMPLKHAQREIRLLEIHPGNFDAELECTLLKSSLGNNKVYQALSYHWGDSTCRCLVTVNEQALAITTNLFVALRHLRHQELRIVIWCDAICINQADTEERNQQVRQMTEIYSSASQVVAWLGPAEGDSDVAMDMLGCIMSEEYNKLSNEYIRRGTRALIDIFRRPWWSRVWIVQEVAVAQIEPLLCCGHKLLPFTAAVVFKEIMTQMMEDMTIELDDFDMLREVLHAVTEAVSPLLACREGYWNNHLGTMRWLLFKTITYQSTDERDKIYAILGLITHHGEPRIYPDYSMSVGRLFREVVIHIMVTEDSLDILSFYGLRSRPDFPSWVPDFAARLRNPAEIVSKPFSTVAEAYNKEGSWARASGDRKPNLDISQDMTTLRAEGLYFDKIEEVIDLKLRSSSREEPMELFTRLAFAMRSVKSRAERIRKLIQSNDPRHLLAEPSFNFTPDVSKSGHSLSDIDLKRRWKVFLSEGEIPSDFERGQDPQSRWGAYVWPAISSFSIWLQKRCVFITSTGSIGLGPSDICKGDEVVILFGGSAPFILRRRVGHHILLGDCAVSGIMAGEMIRIFENEIDAASSLTPQSFALT